jgi:hypothetical protein
MKGRSEKGTYTWSGGSDSIWKQVETQSDAGKDVLEHGDDLQRENVLPAIVSDLEDSCLPDLVVRLVLRRLGRLDEGVLGWDRELDAFLSDLEGRHEGSLKDETGLSVPTQGTGRATREMALP